MCQYIAVDQRLAISKLLSSDYKTYTVPYNVATTDTAMHEVEFSDITIHCTLCIHHRFTLPLSLNSKQTIVLMKTYEHLNIRKTLRVVQVRRVDIKIDLLYRQDTSCLPNLLAGMATRLR